MCLLFLELLGGFPPQGGINFSSAAQLTKTKNHPVGWFSFCDCPQVLLPALLHIARKGECEGGTFDGFPRSRSVTRPQATDFAQQNRCSKKKCHPKGVAFLFVMPYHCRFLNPRFKNAMCKSEFSVLF